MAAKILLRMDMILKEEGEKRKKSFEKMKHTQQPKKKEGDIYK